MSPDEIESKLAELEEAAESAKSEANKAHQKAQWLREVLGRVLDNLQNPAELAKIREEIL